MSEEDECPIHDRVEVALARRSAGGGGGSLILDWIAESRSANRASGSWSAVYVSGDGETIDQAADHACYRALMENRVVYLEFNGIAVRIDPRDRPHVARQRYHAELASIGGRRTGGDQR